MYRSVNFTQFKSKKHGSRRLCFLHVLSHAFGTVPDTYLRADIFDVDGVAALHGPGTSSTRLHHRLIYVGRHVA